MAEEDDIPEKTVSPQSVSPIQPTPQVPLPSNVGIGIAFQTGPIPPQVLEKITSEHIGQLLTSQESQSKRQHDLAVKQLESRERDRDKQRQNRTHGERNMMIFGAVTLTFIIIISYVCFSFQQADIIKFLVPAILGFAGGFFAGRGYERYWE